MRLYEIVQPPLYLCTSQKHSIDDVLVQSGVHPLGAEREGKLEYRRPRSALARDTSFYLDTEPRDAPYVYMVAPIGQLDLHHTSWLKRLGAAASGNEGEMDLYAGGYWTGKPHPEDQDAPIEIRVSSVKVIKRVGGCHR